MFYIMLIYHWINTYMIVVLFREGEISHSGFAIKLNSIISLYTF